MKSTQHTIGTTAVKVVSSNPFAQYVYTHVEGNGTVYLGGSDVTSSNGLETAKHTAPLTFFIPRGQELWAIVAADTETLQVLQEKGA
jgi:hypothetical protein